MNSNPIFCHMTETRMLLYTVLHCILLVVRRRLLQSCTVQYYTILHCRIWYSTTLASGFRRLSQYLSQLPAIDYEAPISQSSKHYPVRHQVLVILNSIFVLVDDDTHCCRAVLPFTFTDGLMFLHCQTWTKDLIL
jgi:hypothetical protein